MHMYICIGEVCIQHSEILCGGRQKSGKGASAGLHESVRAHLLPRGWQGGDRLGRQADEVRAGGAGARTDDTTPIRKHVKQPGVLRVGLLRGEGAREEGGPRMDAGIWHGF